MFHHITVLKEEAINYLNIKPNGIYVDCTLGGAGHSEGIVAQLAEEGVLIAFDQDIRAITHAREKLVQAPCKIELIHENFRELKNVLNNMTNVPRDESGNPQVDGILFDLGVSSPQLDDAERGFSYHQDAPLDMRMNQSDERTAAEVVGEWSEKELTHILYTYGEEKFAKRIAKRIVDERSLRPITSTVQLAEIIKEAIPAATRRSGGHPAKRSFQAIRIAVNDELSVLETALTDAVQCLAPGGRISVITFHSLEDRICKQIFSKYMQRCSCPPDFPICTCGNEGTLKWVQRKPILPSSKELNENNRARSAKLRVAEKL